MQIPPIPSGQPQRLPLSQEVSRLQDFSGPPPCPLCGPPQRVYEPWAPQGLAIACPHQLAELQAQDRMRQRVEARDRKLKAFGHYPVPVDGPKSMAELAERGDEGGSAMARAELRRYIQTWEARKAAGHGFYLWGGVGAGKTSAVSALANELEADGYYVLFTGAEAFVERCKGEFASAATWLRACQEADLLVFDDLEREQHTAFSIGKVINMLNQRFDAGRPIVLTCNWAPAVMAEIYRAALGGQEGSMTALRLLSRISQRCRVAQDNSPDRRLNNKPEW